MAGDQARPSAMPRNAVVILLDSLNRHMLGCYGGREFATPNLDAFARRAVRFENHYTGSLPCMPARHDLLCGALDFLWKPWGSIELWERPLTVYLRRTGVITKLVSDHPHLFEVGGENYHCDFTAWDYQRGHETDPWRTRPDPSWIGAPSWVAPGEGRESIYSRNRKWFRGEEDFPGPKVMAAAARWLEEEAPAHDRFLLFIDEFDPHEPFDTPEPFASMYDRDWQGNHLIWPPYTVGALRRGMIDERQARQVRASYGGKLTMIDKWVGHLLTALERSGYSNNTAVIICTDHGHYLGEKDVWGKPAVPVYETLGHIPMMISWPGATSRSISALSTNVDISATLADIFGAKIEHRTHGRSLAPLVNGAASSVREWALTGMWGREVQVVLDEGFKYSRAPSSENAPLSVFSNRWSTMPITNHRELLMPAPDERAVLDRMPGSRIPVIRQTYQAGDMLPYWGLGKFKGNDLYNLRDDPGEDRNLAGTAVEKRLADALRAALESLEAPRDQMQRLGLS